MYQLNGEECMKRIALALLLAVMSTVAYAQTTDLGKPQVFVNDASINAGDDVTWTKDNVYILDGYVYVEDGATLTIEAGTVVKALQDPTDANQKSVLVIARGAQIFANGTANEPIIFTAYADSVALSDDDPNNGDLHEVMAGKFIAFKGPRAKPVPEVVPLSLTGEQRAARLAGSAAGAAQNAMSSEVVERMLKIDQAAWLVQKRIIAVNVRCAELEGNRKQKKVTDLNINTYPQQIHNNFLYL